jgi:hypothetical protein
MCNVDHHTVTKYRISDFGNPKSEKKYIHNKTGKETIMDTSNIGKKKESIKKEVKEDIEKIEHKKPVTSYTMPIEEQGEDLMDEFTKTVVVNGLMVESKPKNFAFADYAINQLKRIDESDGYVKETFQIVTNYINNKLKEMECAE